MPNSHPFEGNRVNIEKTFYTEQFFRKQNVTEALKLRARHKNKFNILEILVHCLAHSKITIKPFLYLLYESRLKKERVDRRFKTSLKILTYLLIFSIVFILWQTVWSSNMKWKKTSATDVKRVTMTKSCYCTTFLRAKWLCAFFLFRVETNGTTKQPPKDGINLHIVSVI